MENGGVYFFGEWLYMYVAVGGDSEDGEAVISAAIDYMVRKPAAGWVIQ